MKKHKWLVGVGAAALTAVLLFAVCGDDSDKNKDTFKEGYFCSVDGQCQLPPITNQAGWDACKAADRIFISECPNIVWEHYSCFVTQGQCNPINSMEQWDACPSANRILSSDTRCQASGNNWQQGFSCPTGTPYVCTSINSQQAWDACPGRVPSNSTQCTDPNDTRPSHAVTVVGGTGSGTFRVGDTVSVLATIPNNHTFTGWTSTSAGVEFFSEASQSGRFVMPNNAVIVTANFEAIQAQSYMLTVTSLGTGATQSGERVAGSSVTVTAGTPPAGQVFSLWLVTPGHIVADPTTSSVTFTMPDEPVTLVAIFGQANQTFTLTTSVSPAGAGTITPAGQTTHSANATVQLTATANAGWVFHSWEGANGTATSASVIMSSDRAVIVHFTQSQTSSEFCNWLPDATSAGGCWPINNATERAECIAYACIHSNNTCTAPVQGERCSGGPTEFCDWGPVTTTGGGCWPVTAADRADCVASHCVHSNSTCTAPVQGAFCGGGPIEYCDWGPVTSTGGGCWPVTAADRADCVASHCVHSNSTCTAPVTGASCGGASSEFCLWNTDGDCWSLLAAERANCLANAWIFSGSPTTGLGTFCAGGTFVAGTNTSPPRPGQTAQFCNYGPCVGSTPDGWGCLDGGCYATTDPASCTGTLTNSCPIGTCAPNATHCR